MHFRHKSQPLECHPPAIHLPPTSRPPATHQPFTCHPTATHQPPATKLSKQRSLSCHTSRQPGSRPPPPHRPYHDLRHPAATHRCSKNNSESSWAQTREVAPLSQPSRRVKLRKAAHAGLRKQSPPATHLAAGGCQAGVDINQIFHCCGGAAGGACDTPAGLQAGPRRWQRSGSGWYGSGDGTGLCCLASIPCKDQQLGTRLDAKGSHTPEAALMAGAPASPCSTCSRRGVRTAASPAGRRRGESQGRGAAVGVPGAHAAQTIRPHQHPDSCGSSRAVAATACTQAALTSSCPSSSWQTGQISASSTAAAPGLQPGPATPAAADPTAAAASPAAAVEPASGPWPAASAAWASAAWAAACAAARAASRSLMPVR